MLREAGRVALHMAIPSRIACSCRSFTAGGPVRRSGGRGSSIPTYVKSRLDGGVVKPLVAVRAGGIGCCTPRTDTAGELCLESSSSSETCGSSMGWRRYLSFIGSACWLSLRGDGALWFGLDGPYCCGGCCGTGLSRAAAHGSFMVSGSVW